MTADAIARDLEAPAGPLPSYVLVPGSERRAEQLAGRLADVRTLAHEDDRVLLAGALDGVPVAVCSTGIGGQGVARVLEALGSRGATTFIRVGVTGAIADAVRTGDLVVASAAVRMDGTSDRYVDPAYPAVADALVTAALLAAGEATGAAVHVGVGATASSFYAGEGIPAFRGFRSSTTAGIDEELRALGVLDWDTETSALFTIARLRGWRAGRINAVVDDRAGAGYDPRGEPRAVEAAIGAVRLLARLDASAAAGGRP